MKSLTLMIAGVSLFPFFGCKVREKEATPNDPPPEAVQRAEPMALHRGDLAWLTKNSTLVFVGRLLTRRTETDNRGLIITRNHFTIERLLVGESSSGTITLTTLGGRLADKTLRVSHMPQFREDLRYVVLADPSRKTYDPVVGNQDGVFVVGPADGVYTYGGVSIAAVEKGIIQLGGVQLGQYFKQDTAGPVPIRENPTLRGDIVSAERVERVVRPAIPLEQFTKIVQDLAVRR